MHCSYPIFILSQPHLFLTAPPPTLSNFKFMPVMVITPMHSPSTPLFLSLHLFAEESLAVVYSNYAFHICLEKYIQAHSRSIYDLKP